ncbi:MAG: nicotinamide mononucleotide transporter, partial [Clostridia bacterium]|nr:nicotinamide mononucleotide transporter [Clostridia bacterium]
MKTKEFLKKYLLLILFAIMIIVVSIINQQSFIKTLPTLVTLIVQVLLVAADRKAFMLGGLNSILYGLSYILDGVYFSAIYAFLISFPVQIYSFFNWKRNSANNKVQFKVLGKIKLPITIALILAMWAGVYLGLSRFFVDATLPIVDTLLFTLGVATTFL